MFDLTFRCISFVFHQTQIIMAKVIFGGGISSISGSIAGQVFSRNSNGAYIRNRAVPVNPNTDKQKDQRDSFRNLSQAWRNLTDVQRASWVAQRTNYPYQDSSGQTKLYTAQQLFMKLNMNLIAAGLATISTAITPEEAPSFSVGIDTLDQSGTQVIIDVNGLAGDVVPAGYTVIVRATGNSSAGVSYFAPQAFKQLATVSPTDSALAIDVSAPFNLTFGVPKAGSRIGIEVVMVNNSTGQMTAPVRTSGIVSA